MNVSRSGIAAALLTLPVLAAHAVTTAEFASKAPAAPATATAVAPARAASAATPTPPASMQRQTDAKARGMPPAAPKPAQR